MATITGTQTLTVAGVSREYNPGWSSVYSNDLKRGNASVKKCALNLVSHGIDGESLLRFVHDAKSSIERHVVTLEDRLQDGATSDIVRVNITLTCLENSPTATTRLKELVTGICSYLPTVFDSIAQEEL